MSKKRLTEALNAGKLIDLGIQLKSHATHGSYQPLALLYRLNCITNQVHYAKPDHVSSSKGTPNSDEGIENESDIDSQANTPFLLDTGAIKSDAEEEEKVEVLCLRFNESHNLLATGDSNGNIQLVDIFSGLPVKSEINGATSHKIKQQKNHHHVHNMPIICLKWHPCVSSSTNYVYYAHVNGFIGMMDKTSMNKSLVIEESDEIACIDFSRDGASLAAVGKETTIRLYDANVNSSALHTRVCVYGGSDANNPDGSSSPRGTVATSHTNRLQAVKFSDVSNDVFFTGGWDRTVKMWDKRLPAGLVSSFHGPFICGSDAIDVNDNYLLTAAWVKENALNLWDLRQSGKSLSTLPVVCENNSGQYLYACKFFNDEHHTSSPYITQSSTDTTHAAGDSLVLTCGSGTQSLHLIDSMRPERHIASIDCKSPLYCLDSVHACSLVACGGVRNMFVLMTSDHLAPHRQ